MMIGLLGWNTRVVADIKIKTNVQNLLHHTENTTEGRDCQGHVNSTFILNFN